LSKESYWLWIFQETEKAARAHKGCTAIQEQGEVDNNGNI
jgi:hypothetical protein